MIRRRLILGYGLLLASVALAALGSMALAVAAWLGCCLALGPGEHKESAP